MSRRRPRISECETPQDFVRAGVLRPVQPTTATGTCTHGSVGKLFSPDVPVTVLKYSNTANGVTLMPNTGFTVAARVAPAFASTTATTTWMLELRNAADNQRSASLQWNSGRYWWWELYDGVANPEIHSLTPTFDAGSVHHLVGRVDSEHLDLNYDGTTKDQVANTATLAVGTYLGLGCRAAGTGQFNGYIGPVIISPGRKSDGWTTAIQAGSGAAYASTPRLVRDFLAVGDLIAPLGLHSTAYIRVR